METIDMSMILMFTVLMTQIIVIVLFIYRLKYVKAYGLTLWGINLILEIGFTEIFGLLATILFPKIPSKDISILNENLFFVINLGIVLLLFSKFKSVNKSILIGVFGIFLAVWLIEFWFQFMQSDNGQTFYYAARFLRLIVVGLVLWYLAELFATSKSAVIHVPFFWTTIGWFTYYFISQTAFIPEIAEMPFKEMTGAVLLEFIIFSAASFLAFVFYGIGFWKTKDWVLKNTK